MLFRNIYNNHRASDPYISSIHENSDTYIQKYYSIALSRWKLRFFRGIFLVALSYATRTHKVKFKGRQINDTSALI